MPVWASSWLFCMLEISHFNNNACWQYSVMRADTRSEKLPFCHRTEPLSTERTLAEAALPIANEEG